MSYLTNCDPTTTMTRTDEERKDHPNLCRAHDPWRVPTALASGKIRGKITKQQEIKVKM